MSKETTNQLLFLILLAGAALFLDFQLFRWRRSVWQKSGGVGLMTAWLAWLGHRVPWVWRPSMAPTGVPAGPTETVSPASTPTAPQITAVLFSAPATAAPGDLSAQMALPGVDETVVLPGTPVEGEESQPLSPAVETQSPEAVDAREMVARPAVETMPADGESSGSPTAPAAAPQVRVNISVDMPEGTTVYVTIESGGRGSSPKASISQPVSSPPAKPIFSGVMPAPRPSPAGSTPSALPAGAPLPPPLPARLGANLSRVARAGASSWRQRLTVYGMRWQVALEARALLLEAGLFLGALGLYLITHLIGLTQYPIYFFSDEAIHTVRAAELLRDGFSYAGEFLPTYVQNGPFWNLSVSVYLQLVPLLVFGESVFVTRAVSMLVTFFGALAVSLILRDIFKARYWWSGMLLLSIAPAWFLHSRTAFEVVEMVSFYAGFLYFYLRYRCDNPRYLYPALVLGALAFYTYSPGQMVMAVTGLLLLIVDWRHHWKNRAMLWRVVVLAVVLALPYARFQLNHSSAVFGQLRERGSILVQPVPVGQKIAKVVSEYLYGLSPMYWYFPNNRDLVRHVMTGYGNLLLATLPLAILGLLQTLKSWRSAAHRVLLVALLAAPTGGALADIGMPRVLVFVVPATLLTALGVALLLDWAVKRWGRLRPALAVGLFVVLGGFNLFMLRDALVNGPFWSHDYGLYGMQYGAEQLFGEIIPQELERDPAVRFDVSPSWANGTDIYLPFFLSRPQQARVVMRNIDYYLAEKRVLDPNVVLVMMPNEYDNASRNPKLKAIQIDRIIPYPDGKPGFYFARIAYADNVEAVFVDEAAARRQLTMAEVSLNGQSVKIGYSNIGDAAIQNVFDGNRDTLVRGVEANPFVLEFTFPEPRSVTGIKADFGSMDLTLVVKLYAPGSDVPVKLSQTYRDQPPDPHVEMKIDNAPAQVSKMRVEILNLLAGDTANIHIREFNVLP
jgi:4-amino-4-deoxy-L-arabinose transferase-like glycosyltransferase